MNLLQFVKTLAELAFQEVTILQAVKINSNQIRGNQY